MKELLLEKQRLIALMSELEPSSDEYAKIAAMLKLLTDVQSTSSVTKVWLPHVANLFGLLTILNFEKVGVFTSKAVMYMTKR